MDDSEVEKVLGKREGDIQDNLPYGICREPRGKSVKSIDLWNWLVVKQVSLAPSCLHQKLLTAIQYCF